MLVENDAAQKQASRLSTIIELITCQFLSIQSLLMSLRLFSEGFTCDETREGTRVAAYEIGRCRLPRTKSMIFHSFYIEVNYANFASLKPGESSK
jgi:hypothetical protein